MTNPPPPHGGPPRAAVRRVWFAAALACTVALAATVWFIPVEPPTTTGLWQVLGLAVAVAVAERWSLNARIGHVSQRLTLSEIPLVVGAFVASPLVLLVARVAGGLVAMQVMRRQEGFKTAYNLAYMWVETLLVIALVRLLGPQAISDGLRASAVVIGVAAAVALSGAVANAGASSALAGRVAVAGTIRTIRDGFLPSLATAAATTVAVVLAQVDPILLWAPAATLVVLLLAYRSHLGLIEVQDMQAELITITHDVTGDGDVEETAARLAAAARRMTDATVAGIRMPDPTTGQPRWYGPSAKDTGPLERAVRTHASAVTGNGVVAPITTVDDCWLAVCVDGAPTDLDRRIVDMLANHAAVALSNALHRAALQQQADEASFQARHDALTGLPNRTALLAGVDGAIEEGQPFAVLMIDLDNFKEINDALGHAAGDAVLTAVSRRLDPGVEGLRLLSRLGGDEFAALLPGGEALSRDVAETMRDRISRPVNVGPYTLEVGSSVGIALFPEHGHTADELLKHADLAMYEAKEQGGGTSVFGAAAGGRAMRQLAISTGLRAAIQDGAINLVFQPLLDLAGDRVQSVEALARWTHPTLGPIAPDEFVRVAEQAGMITDLTREVLDMALAWRRRWSEDGVDLRVAVNLSARSLLDSDLPRMVARALDSHSTPPERLVLELTESSVLVDPPRALAVLARLTRLGVRLAIDDFGTGQSSLAYLRQIPAHEVKVDKSFVLPMLDEPRALPLVSGIIHLCQEMGFSVVAEGVETPATLETLRALGCNFAQGYGIARPMPPEDVVAWVLRRPEGRSIRLLDTPPADSA